jgi:lipid II:glycine glycyltransferase (peptidoglycan interpeptide bridge formation enzyme)
MLNPPGTFAKIIKKTKEVDFIKYEATEYEHNAYKAFEAAIRDI